MNYKEAIERLRYWENSFRALPLGAQQAIQDTIFDLQQELFGEAILPKEAPKKKRGRKKKVNVAG